MGGFRNSSGSTALLVVLLALAHYAEANRRGSLLQPNEATEDDVAPKAAVAPSGTGTPTASSRGSTAKSSPVTQPPQQRSSELLQPLTTKDETAGTTPDGDMQDKTGAKASALGSSPSFSSSSSGSSSSTKESSPSPSDSSSSSFTQPGDSTDDNSNGGTTGITGSSSSTSMNTDNEGKTITSSGDSRGSLRPVAAQVNETSSTVGLSVASSAEGSSQGTSLKPSSASGSSLGLTPLKETSAHPSTSLGSSNPSAEEEPSSSSTKGLMRATTAPARTTPHPNAYTSRNSADGLASRPAALSIALAPALALLLATWPR